MKLFERTRQQITLKDFLVTLAVLAASTAICLLLRFIDHTAVYASMFFILAVFIVSRMTKGYLCGIIASLIGVLMVNYVFTYPYFEFNFTLSGYPITIMCMLAVSITTSTLTTQIKNQEKIKIEAEREKTRSNLLRAVSHDLRTPLTSILGSASAMMENDSYITKEERIKLLGNMKEESEWLIRMVENLLSITRIDGGGTAKIVKELEAVEEIVADSLVKFKKRFPETEITVSVPDELVFVPMDAVLIEQVIINILENAVIHTENSVTVRFDVKSEGDSVSFTISDNGNGIPEAILPHIFDGYFNSRYEKSSDKKRNMGIGLSVCNTIIKAHNGTMTAGNNKNGGAYFTFCLPK